MAIGTACFYARILGRMLSKKTLRYATDRARAGCLDRDHAEHARTRPLARVINESSRETVHRSQVM